MPEDLILSLHEGPVIIKGHTGAEISQTYEMWDGVGAREYLSGHKRNRRRVLCRHGSWPTATLEDAAITHRICGPDQSHSSNMEWQVRRDIVEVGIRQLPKWFVLAAMYRAYRLS